MKVYYAVDILSLCDDLSKRVSRSATNLSMRLSVYSKIPNSLSYANPGTFFFVSAVRQKCHSKRHPTSMDGKKTATTPYPDTKKLSKPGTRGTTERRRWQRGRQRGRHGCGRLWQRPRGRGRVRQRTRRRSAFGMLLGGSHVGEKADLPVVKDLVEGLNVATHSIGATGMFHVATESPWWDILRFAGTNMSGHDVPSNVLETLGLGLEFIPSSNTFSVNEVMDTLNSICARLFKESVKEPYSDFSPPFSRPPLFKWNQRNKNDKKCVSDLDVESLKELDNEGIISKFHSLGYDDINSTFKFSTYRFLNLDLNTNPSDVKSFTDYFTLNKNIIVAELDKSLGILVLTAEMERKSAHKHLLNASNYRPLSLLEAKNAVEDFFVFLQDWCLRYFGKDHWKHPDAIEILSITPDRSLYPKFKQLYKAASVFRGDLIYDSRPICALNSFITCAASKFLHELLKPALNCIKEPTIVTSSREAFVSISNMVLPDDCFLASFDVKALYPSIPIPLACSLLRKLLLELPNCYSPVDIPLIVELVRAVLTTNIVNFKGDLFLQTFGGAMGSSCFPSIAIIFLYMIERSFVRSVLGSSCLVFKRYLDDMFAVFTSKAAALSFFTRYNALVQGIEITWSNEVDGGVVFLDLLFFKGPRFLTCNSLDSKLYQKPNNAFLYLHFKSFHSESARTSWVVDRLKTLERYCSSIDDYLSLRRQFAIRLRNRRFSRV
jgi:hypothetical protein